MTVKEAIQSYPGLSDIPDNYTEKVLVDRVLDGTIDYTLSLRQSVALCAADCYVALTSSPDFSEGKLSMKFSRGAMRLLAESLYRDNGETTKADALKAGKGSAKSNWW